MNKMHQRFREIGIIPVVVLEDARVATPLANALLEGGIPCAEVTFRTKAALDTIYRMTDSFPELLVGAGTVLSTEQVDSALSAGAKFIVSPGLDPSVVRYCQEKGVPVTPGVQTPSEIQQALSLGLDVVKFFPAELSGGLKMIKALASVFPNVSFLPTGGINLQNAREYLGYERILALGGSWMVKGELIRERNFEVIKAMVREAASLVREVRG